MVCAGASLCVLTDMLSKYPKRASDRNETNLRTRLGDENGFDSCGVSGVSWCGDDRIGRVQWCGMVCTGMSWCVLTVT
jgi:hypothetical protein